jgi:hypothetical protein
MGDRLFRHRPTQSHSVTGDLNFETGYQALGASVASRRIAQTNQFIAALLDSLRDGLQVHRALSRIRLRKFQKETRTYVIALTEPVNLH